MVNLESIVIIKKNIDVLRTAYVIPKKEFCVPKKTLQSFIMDLTMIIVLLLQSWQKNLKNSLFV